jgi:hypothetical protein
MAKGLIPLNCLPPFPLNLKLSGGLDIRHEGISSFILLSPYYIYGSSSLHFPVVRWTKSAMRSIFHREASWTVQQTRKDTVMLLAIGVVLLVLWLLGLLISYTFGGFIHILLAIALVVFLFHIFSSRRKPA